MSQIAILSVAYQRCCLLPSILPSNLKFSICDFHLQGRRFSSVFKHKSWR